MYRALRGFVLTTIQRWFLTQIEWRVIVLTFFDLPPPPPPLPPKVGFKGGGGAVGP